MGRNSAPLTVARLAACRLAKLLCLPLTYRNLYVIELALEAESAFSQCSIAKAAETVLEGAQVGMLRGECLNYFWFEDCCWRRSKLSFKEMDEIRLRRSLY